MTGGGETEGNTSVIEHFGEKKGAESESRGEKKSSKIEEKREKVRRLLRRKRGNFEIAEGSIGQATRETLGG